MSERNPHQSPHCSFRGQTTSNEILSRQSTKDEEDPEDPESER
jgi:hypothetical protein